MLTQACFYTSHLISYFSWLRCQSCNISHDDVVPRCDSTCWSCGVCCVWSSCIILSQTLKKDYILWLDFLSSWNLKSQPVARGKSSMLIMLLFNVQIFTNMASFFKLHQFSLCLTQVSSHKKHCIKPGAVAMLLTICCRVIFSYLLH